MAAPPAFENASNCSFCGTGFSLLKRKHHCRACGKTACGSCANNNVTIPSMGFTTPVRVCSPCNDKLKSKDAKVAPAPATSTTAPTPTPTSAYIEEPVCEKKVSNCTCGSPLCICAPDEEPAEEPVVAKEVPKAAPKPRPQPAKPITTTFFSGFGGSTKQTYDLTGDLNEQCRDAVKAKDLDGVKTLLGAKADAKYVDRTGNTLVHMAALFNKLDLVTLLIEHGADVHVKNPAGETAIDLAPATLQFKMKQMSKFD